MHHQLLRGVVKTVVLMRRRRIGHALKRIANVWAATKERAQWIKFRVWDRKELFQRLISNLLLSKPSCSENSPVLYWLLNLILSRFVLQLPLELLQLSFKAIIWMYKVALGLYMLECILERHAILLHKKSNDYWSAAGYSSETMNKNTATGVNCFFHKAETSLKVLFEVCRRRVQYID